MKFTRPELAVLYQSIVNEMAKVTKDTAIGYADTLIELEKKLFILFKK